MASSIQVSDQKGDEDWHSAIITVLSSGYASLILITLHNASSAGFSWMLMNKVTEKECETGD